MTPQTPSHLQEQTDYRRRRVVLGAAVGVAVVVLIGFGGVRYAMFRHTSAQMRAEGIALLEQGQAVEATALLQEYTLRRPSDHEALYWLAKAKATQTPMSEERLQEAVILLEELRSRAPGHDLAGALLLRCLVALGMHDEAYPLAIKLADRNPADPYPTRLLLQSDLAMGRLDAAIKRGANTLADQRTPKTFRAEVLQALITAHTGKNEPNAALHYAEVALRDSPGSLDHLERFLRLAYRYRDPGTLLAPAQDHAAQHGPSITSSIRLALSHHYAAESAEHQRRPVATQKLREKREKHLADCLGSGDASYVAEVITLLAMIDRTDEAFGFLDRLVQVHASDEALRHMWCEQAIYAEQYDAVLGFAKSSPVAIDDPKLAGPIGFAALRLGEQQTLDHCVERLLSASVDSPFILPWLTLLDANKHSPIDAIGRLQAMAYEHSNSAVAWHALGTSLDAAGNHADALASFLKASAIAPHWDAPRQSALASQQPRVNETLASIAQTRDATPHRLPELADTLMRDGVSPRAAAAMVRALVDAGWPHQAQVTWDKVMPADPDLGWQLAELTVVEPDAPHHARQLARSLAPRVIAYLNQPHADVSNPATLSLERQHLADVLRYSAAMRSTVRESSPDPRISVALGLHHDATADLLTQAKNLNELSDALHRLQPQLTSTEYTLKGTTRSLISKAWLIGANPQHALRASEPSIQNTPSNPNPPLWQPLAQTANLILLNELAGNTTQARHLREQLVSHNPADLLNHVDAASALLKIGEVDAAERCIDALNQTAPLANIDRLKLSRVYLALNRPTAAAATLQSILEQPSGLREFAAAAKQYAALDSDPTTTQTILDSLLNNLNAEPAVNHLRAAILQHSLGRTQSADKHLQASLAEDPGLTSAWRWRLELQLSQSNAQALLSTLQQASTSARSPRHFIRLQEHTDTLQEAVADPSLHPLLQEALTTDQDPQPLLLAVGLLLNHPGGFQEQDLEQMRGWAGQAPRSWPMQQVMLALYAEVGDTKRFAEHVLWTAFHHDEADRLYELLDVSLRANLPDVAEPLAGLLLVQEPVANASTRRVLASLAHGRGDTAAAVAWLERATGITPYDSWAPAPLSLAASIYASARYTTESDAVIKLAVSHSPTAQASLIAQAQRDAKAQPQQLLMLTRAVTSALADTPHASIRVPLAGICQETYRQTGDERYAEAGLDVLLALLHDETPDHAAGIEAFVRAASLNHALGRLPHAEKYYRLALKLNPDDAVLQNNLAQVLIDRGHLLDEAQILAEYAQSQLGDHPAVRDTLSNLQAVTP